MYSLNFAAELLFEATYNAYVDLMALETPVDGEWSQEYAEAFGRFSSLYELVEGIDLEEEYQEWKKREKDGETDNENETEIEKE